MNQQSQRRPAPAQSAPAQTGNAQNPQAVAISRLKKPEFVNALKAVLPKGMSVDRYVAICAAEIKSPALTKVTEPSSIVLAVYHAAKLGLSLNAHMGEAYLVPFADRHSGKVLATFMPGYKGLTKLARQAGVKDVDAINIHQKDKFEPYEDETGFHFTLTPHLDGDPGPTVSVLAKAVLSDGTCKYQIIRINDLMKTREAALRKTRGTGPWTTHPDEMFKKTGIRRICKTLPQSENLALAVRADEAFEGAPLAAEVPEELSGVVDAEYSDVVDKVNENQGKPESNKPETEAPQPKEAAATSGAPLTPRGEWIMKLAAEATKRGISEDDIPSILFAEFNHDTSDLQENQWEAALKLFTSMPAAR